MKNREFAETKTDSRLTQPVVVFSGINYSCLHAAVKHAVDSSLTKWIFIGRDAMLIDRVSAILNQRIERIDLAEKIAAAQKQYRDDYVSFIDDVESSTGDLLWWSGSLSWKNPWASAFLLRFSQLMILLGVIKDRLANGHGLVVVFEEPLMQRVAINNIKRVMPAVAVINIREFAASTRAAFALIAAGLFTRIQLLFFFIKKKIEYRRVVDKIVANDTVELSQKNSCICPTFIDHRSFRDGRYFDAFLGSLLETEIFRNYSITVVPVLILAQPEQLDQFISWINARGFRVVIPLDTLTFPGLFLRLLRSVFQISWSLVSRNLCGVDVSSLVLWERAEDWRSGSRFQAGLMDCVCQRFGRDVAGKQLLLYPFENQAWERIFLYYMRKYSDVYAIGIQNAPCPSLSTRFFLSKTAVKICPLPDALIANGDISYETFKPLYQSRVTVEKSSLLRAISVTIQRKKTSKTTVAGASSSPLEIVVVCSIGVYEARELMYRAVKALGNMAEYNVQIAVHPLINMAELFSAGFMEFPPNVTFANKPMDTLLVQADVVLFDSSTVGLQALAIGLPAVFIGHECALNIDPTEYDDVVIHRAYTLDQIREIIKKICATPNLQYIAADTGKKIAGKYFGTNALPTAIDVVGSLMKQLKAVRPVPE